MSHISAFCLFREALAVFTQQLPRLGQGVADIGCVEHAKYEFDPVLAAVSNRKMDGEYWRNRTVPQAAAGEPFKFDFRSGDRHVHSVFSDSVFGDLSVGEARHLRQWWGGGATRILPRLASRAGAAARRVRPALFREGR